MENQRFLQSLTIVRAMSDNCRVLCNVHPATSRPVNAYGNWKGQQENNHGEKTGKQLPCQPMGSNLHIGDSSQTRDEASTLSIDPGSSVGRFCQEQPTSVPDLSVMHTRPAVMIETTIYRYVRMSDSCIGSAE